MNSDVSTSVAGWLTAHHAVIGAREARKMGATGRQMAWKVTSGEWVRVGRGVYRLAGAPVTPAGELRAAVLLAGEGAVASHWSAAWLWGIADLPDRPMITVPHRRVTMAKDLHVIRSRVPFRVTVRNRISCTEVIRTIFDCAANAGSETDRIDDLLDRAIARRAVRIQDVTAALGKMEYRRHNGRPLVEERLARRGVTGSLAPSVLESRMARLFVEYGLPVPKAEVQWGPQRRYRLDFAYPAIRLAIEVDGWSAHFTPEQQRWDRRRGNSLARAGWTVLHYDWWEVTYEPERVAREIADTYRGLAA